MFASNIKVIEQIGEGIVPLIEMGEIESNEMTALLKLYLQPMLDANIDHLVLGCSHYPYLTPMLKTLLPANVKIIDSGEAVARQTKAILEQENLCHAQSTNTKSEFYTNGNPEIMKELLEGEFDVNFLEF